jgi:hypothetical protein
MLEVKGEYCVSVYTFHLRSTSDNSFENLRRKQNLPAEPKARYFVSSRLESVQKNYRNEANFNL